VLKFKRKFRRQRVKERTRFSQLSASFFFVVLFSICSSYSPSNLQHDRASECARCYPNLERQINNFLWVHFLQIFLQFPSFCSNFRKLLKRSVTIFFYQCFNDAFIHRMRKWEDIWWCKTQWVSPLLSSFSLG
jgi:hypothetical protein